MACHTYISSIHKFTKIQTYGEISKKTPITFHLRSYPYKVNAQMLYIALRQSILV